MEEGAADIAAPPTGGAERVALPIGEFGKRLAVSRCGQSRIVKLVSAHAGPPRSQRPVAKHPCLAIAEVELARGKTCRMAEQSGHGMTRAIGIFQPLAEHHVAPAFAVHRPHFCKSGEPGTKARR